MQPGDRIQKSAAGRTAVADRSQDLPSPLRTLLLMVYGDKTAAEYGEIATRLPAGREGLQNLLALGLIEIIPTLDETVGRSPDTTTPPVVKQRLHEPPADVAPVVAAHTMDEAALQRLLYPEFVRAVADVGLRGVMLQMRVERAMSTKELLELRDEVEAALLKSKGKQARIDFAKRVDTMLSQQAA